MYASIDDRDEFGLDFGHCQYVLYLTKNNRGRQQLDLSVTGLLKEVGGVFLLDMVSSQDFPGTECSGGSIRSQSARTAFAYDECPGKCGSLKIVVVARGSIGSRRRAGRCHGSIRPRHHRGPCHTLSKAQESGDPYSWELGIQESLP